MTTAWQTSLPLPGGSLENHFSESPYAMSEPVFMDLSWNERRKMKRYQKQVEKDAAKHVRAEKRERRREEKVLEKQWEEYYKANEKETKKWRKAAKHHPDLNYSAGSSGNPAGLHSSLHPQTHHHAFHLLSPHITHATAGHQPTRPLPQPFSTNTGAYTAQYLPVSGQLGTSTGQPAPMLPSLAAFGVLDRGPVHGHGSAMSRTMTQALLELEHDTYIRFGQRGLIA